MNIQDLQAQRMLLTGLRTRRIELEEEIELWQDQIALTNRQIEMDEFNMRKPSKTTKRRNRNAQDNLRRCQHDLNRLKNEIISCTAIRLGLADLQGPEIF